MKITLKYLKSIGACKELIEAYKQNKEPKELKKVFKMLMNKDNNYSWRDNEGEDYNTLEWANWLICRLLNNKQKIQYAVFAAKQANKIVYTDKGKEIPQVNKNAIKAAEKYIKNPNQENATDAYAAYVAYANAYIVYANVYAAYANVYAAYAAYVVYTAYPNAYAAYIAYAAYVAAVYTAAYIGKKNKLRIKILKYGLKLLNIKENK